MGRSPTQTTDIRREQHRSDATPAVNLAAPTVEWRHALTSTLFHTPVLYMHVAIVLYSTSRQVTKQQLGHECTIRV